MDGISGSKSKKIVAISSAEYRNHWIYYTAEGYVVVINDKQYDPCTSIQEATGLIDAAYATVLMDPRMVRENEIAQ